MAQQDFLADLLVGQGLARPAPELLAAAGHRLQAHLQSIALQHGRGHRDDGREGDERGEGGGQVGGIDEVGGGHILKLTIRFMMKTPMAIQRHAPPRMSWPAGVWNSTDR